MARNRTGGGPPALCLLALLVPAFLLAGPMSAARAGRPRRPRPARRCTARSGRTGSDAYNDILNYDHRGGEAIEWLQLAGCPPVWAADSERWLPNGSDCDAPCEMAEERVRVALTPDEHALPAEEPALEGDHRRRLRAGVHHRAGRTCPRPRTTAGSRSRSP